MQYPDPNALLAGPLGDWLSELEYNRRETRKQGLVRLAFALPALAVFLFFLDFGLFAKFSIGAVAAGFIWRWAQTPGNDLMTDVKIEINAAIARAMEIEYIPFSDANFAYECAAYFGVLPSHDESAFEDHWRGEFDGRAFELIETDLKAWREDSKGNRRLSKVFDGALLSIASNAEFQCATMVREKNPLRDWQETYVIDGPTSPYERNMTQVTLGNAEFDKRFECFSEDPAEAKRLITPKIMSNIERVADAFGEGNHTSGLFHDGHFVAAVRSGYLFEARSYAGANDYEVVSRTIEEFATILEATRGV